MRTLVSFILLSLGGFYEGPNGEFDWPVVVTRRSAVRG
jgi:hypothetical protein